ncbi:MAG: class I SAM-dependent rRNA methyltransferase [Candidatus Omnitrophica bacterium]|nr:class I SAM-dependent rRNA methyltransferase [Candidatus Omnitrophota bacterium]
MDTANVQDLLEKALLKRLPLKGVTNALRLVNGYGDGMEGLILEQYNRHFVVSILETEWHQHCQTILDFVKTRLNAEYFIVKDRTASASSEPGAFRSAVWLNNGSSQTIVEENNLKFSVDLNDTLNSGLFLDMRSNRAAVAVLAHSRKVLNCFAYTCSFGVHCRASGAASVVNVDVGRKCLERGRQNYELNNIPAEKNEFIRADAVQYLERAAKKDNRFDMIILDPPSFARHEGNTFSVKKDLAPLVASAMNVLNPGGVIFVATNYSLMSHDGLCDMVSEAAGERQLQKMERFGQDIDFPGSGLMQESYLVAVLALMKNIPS